MKKKIITLGVTAIMALGLNTGCESNDYNEIQTKEMTGIFYSLEEAYDDGLLTVKNLQSIANHQNNGTLPNDVLSVELLNAIKESWAEKLIAQSNKEAIVEDIIVFKYYGTYGDCIAVMLYDGYTDYIDEGRTEVIADIIFNYQNGNSIMLWMTRN